MSKTYLNIRNLQKEIEHCDKYKPNTYEMLIERTFLYENTDRVFRPKWTDEDIRGLRTVVELYIPLSKINKSTLEKYRKEVIQRFENTDSYRNLMESVRMKEKDFYESVLRKVEQLMCSPIEVWDCKGFYEDLYGKYGCHIEMGYDAPLELVWTQLEKEYNKSLPKKDKCKTSEEEKVKKAKIPYEVCLGEEKENKRCIEVLKRACEKFHESCIVACRDLIQTQKRSTEFKLLTVEAMLRELETYTDFHNMNVHYDAKTGGILIELYHEFGKESLTVNLVKKEHVKKSHISSALEQLKAFSKVPVSNLVYGRCVKENYIMQEIVDTIEFGKES